MIVLETDEDILQFILEALELFKKNYKEDAGGKFENERLLTRVEAALFLKITKPTLAKYTKAGIIKGKSVGNRVLYREEDIIACSKNMSSIKYRMVSASRLIKR